ncbi:MAG TPA: YIP1 family protein [Anaerolineae bacterium]|nr:YIP1 family protein [Anaerolineae bacterium]
MSQEPGALPASEPGRSLSWSEAWLAALTRPSVAAYEELARDPNATTNRAYLWIIVSLLIGAVIQGLVFLLIPDTAMAGLGLTTLFCVAVVGGVIGFFIWSIITQGIARVLEGTGTYAQLVYALAAYTAPLYIINSVLAYIPLLNCLSIVTGIYAIVLNVIAVKAVHQFSWGRAIAASFILWLGLFALAACLVIVVLAILGPAIGNIFSNIVNEI